MRRYNNTEKYSCNKPHLYRLDQTIIDQKTPLYWDVDRNMSSVLTDKLVLIRIVLKIRKHGISSCNIYKAMSGVRTLNALFTRSVPFLREVLLRPRQTSNQPRYLEIWNTKYGAQSSFPLDLEKYTSIRNLLSRSCLKTTDKARRWCLHNMLHLHGLQN